jgi:phosphoribosylanthranilate isomerase
MKDIKIKICGMKDPGNIAGVTRLEPDYLGFILYKRSPRYVSIKKAETLVKNIPPAIKKTAVFVNEPLERAISIARSGIFDILQLHGNESAEYCMRISEHARIIKAFRISEVLPENMEEYQPFCSMFLFDTAGRGFGGTGMKFDHTILSGYNLNTEYILSGGISVDDSFHLRSFCPDKMSGVDLNSRFEISPGIKNITLLKKFIENLRADEDNY